MHFPNAKPYIFATLLIAADLLGLGAAILFPAEGAVPTASFMRTAESFSAARRPIEPVSLSPQEQAPSRDRMAGVASWYGEHWQGRKTASGKRFDVHKLTAAHRSLPLNTHVRVTNIENGKSVIVLINDRGPYVDGRVIDLSTAAARRLGMIKKGLVPVRIEIVDPPMPLITTANADL
jgi:rare lipoprotein A